MRIQTKTAALGLSAAMMLSACNGTLEELQSGTNASVADDVERHAVELAAEIQGDMESLSQQIQSSGTDQEIRDAWNAVQAELTAALASMQTDGAITADGLEEELNDFESVLQAAQANVQPELESTWVSLRSKVERLMS